MSFRSYIKVGKRAEYEGRYTSRVNPFFNIKQLDVYLLQ